MLISVHGPMLVTPRPAQSIADPETAKLKDAAQQFEAMLLGELLKPLQFGGAPGADEESGGANDTIRGFGTEAVAKAIAAGGGFGLGKQIVRQVTAERETGAHAA